MSGLLKDMTVVITGGSGLIGGEFLKTCIENGANTVNADVKDSGTPNVFYVETDINSADSVGSLIKSVSEKYGRIDALVNCAYPRNRNYGRHFFDVEYADFCENVNLNLGGYFLASQKFAEYFKNLGQGNIINIASIYGVTAPKFDIYGETNMTVPVEYAAVKSAIVHLTKYMAAYLKDTGIRVNCITPGGILDGQPEQFLKNYKNECLSKGMLDKGDLNGTLVYLLSGMSRYVNGQNIIVDDGFCL